jgi:hypothetical protein
MFVPIVPTEPIADKEGNRTKAWDNFFQQTQQNMQLSISNEGFWIPSVSSASGSVSPPATGGQLAQLAATFGQQTGINAGTVVFDPAEINGGSSGSPNGQLKVMLADGNFHAITNS